MDFLNVFHSDILKYFIIFDKVLKIHISLSLEKVQLLCFGGYLINILGYFTQTYYSILFVFK